MQPHEIKLAKSQLSTRRWRENVENFINSPRYNYLDTEHQEAIDAECKALAMLDNALTRRMELLGLPV